MSLQETNKLSYVLVTEPSAKPVGPGDENEANSYAANKDQMLGRGLWDKAYLDRLALEQDALEKSEEITST